MIKYFGCLFVCLAPLVSSVSEASSFLSVERSKVTWTTLEVQEVREGGIPAKSCSSSSAYTDLASFSAASFKRGLTDASSVYAGSVQPISNESFQYIGAIGSRGICFYYGGRLIGGAKGALDGFSVTQLPSEGDAIPDIHANDARLLYINPSSRQLSVTVVNTSNITQYRFIGDFNLVTSDDALVEESKGIFYLYSRKSFGTSMMRISFSDASSESIKVEVSQRLPVTIDLNQGPDRDDFRFVENCSNSTTTNSAYSCKVDFVMSAPIFHYRSTKPFNATSESATPHLLYLVGGPHTRVNPLRRLDLMGKIFDYFPNISFVAYDLTGERNFDQNFNRSAKLSTRQILQAFESVSEANVHGTSTPVLVVAESMASQLLSELAKTNKSLDILLFIPALDGRAAAARYWYTPTKSRERNGLILEALKDVLGRRFELGHYHWLDSEAHNPLPFLCARKRPTRIVIMMGSRDTSAPADPDLIQRQLAACKANGIATQLITIDSAEHSEAILAQADFTQGLISSILLNLSPK